MAVLFIKKDCKNKNNKIKKNNCKKKNKIKKKIVKKFTWWRGDCRLHWHFLDTDRFGPVNIVPISAWRKGSVIFLLPVRLTFFRRKNNLVQPFYTSGTNNT